MINIRKFLQCVIQGPKILFLLAIRRLKVVGREKVKRLEVRSPCPFTGLTSEGGGGREV